MVEKQGSELFLLGDLFDFWFEYKKVVPKGFVRVLGKLAAITDSGIPIHYFVGNHDLWVRDYFEKELNTKFGSGFSIQPKFSQSAYFRFHNQSEIFDNLFFVGAGTHPGAGMPGVISSAKVLDKIL